jgi:hypothetical protein
MSDVNLGSIIEGEGYRDAIHIAIAPVVAGMRLEAGSHVMLDEDGAAMQSNTKAIGVVDPFLKTSVAKGQRFYLCLYPRTITALRHEWTHPAFKDEPSPRLDSAESEKWLQSFCSQISYGYDSLLRDAKRASEHGGSICLGDDTPSELYEERTQELVIMHLNRVLGTSISASAGFRCAC